MITFDWLDESFSLRLAVTLLHFLWQGVAVSLLMIVAGWMLKRASAQMRYTVIQRYDLLVNLLQRLIEAVLFFHPVVWFIGRHVSIERENAADDIVLAPGWQPVQYADALVRMAEFSSALHNKRISDQAVALAASGTNASDFKRRVLRLLRNTDTLKLRLTRGGTACD